MQLDVAAEVVPLNPQCSCVLAVAKSSTCGDALKFVLPLSLRNCCRKPFLYSQGAGRGDQCADIGEGRAGGTPGQAGGAEFQGRHQAGECERRLQPAAKGAGPREGCPR